ncbi:MAG: inositol monophosphatase family protein [Planctomycetota bacterium]
MQNTTPPPADTTPLALMHAAKRAALAGGAQLLDWRGRFETHAKGPGDFVTDADIASQQAVRSVLQQAYPAHPFIGEESSTPQAQAAPADGVCWVVDPLDGTTNYLHDFPSYAVSVAAVRGAAPVAGAVYDPVRQEMFAAASGCGAWLGDRRLAASGVRRLADALLAVSLPAAVRSDSPGLRDFVQVVPKCQAVRRIGSAALSLAYVACGRLDAFWAREIHPWDVAAGALLVIEAGGRVTDPHGEAFDVWRPPCVAASCEPLHRALLGQLSPPA